jgi:hypothetical protein
VRGELFDRGEVDFGDEQEGQGMDLEVPAA